MSRYRASIATVLFAGLLTPMLALAEAPAVAFGAALKKKDGKAAAKLVTKDTKYGADGKDASLGSPADKFLTGLFKTLEKTFKDENPEKYDCTQTGRELGFIATSIADTNSSLADWIRSIPESYCTGSEPAEPSFYLTKRIDLDVPHAVIVVESGGDSPALVGFYHF
jgi:hypothetical protein